MNDLTTIEQINRPSYGIRNTFRNLLEKRVPYYDALSLAVKFGEPKHRHYVHDHVYLPTEYAYEFYVDFEEDEEGRYYFAEAWRDGKQVHVFDLTRDQADGIEHQSFEYESCPRKLRRWFANEGVTLQDNRL